MFSGFSDADLAPVLVGVRSVSGWLGQIRGLPLRVSRRQMGD